ncbi:inorganic phosphate transporter [Streptomyces aidingensis]|uniref:Inorganic phosphate transporter, PiT family n=1 Tax=Streptomyces aidingensis TaxID=910347 RepID=A0A1I1HSE7_9ACTN|nr:inorganic phosphate transporter [Streptomyces aidingensis]SFC27007.1 inorganic phosphate transporter, PiT family [Streptomyces aidingensis]
MDALALGAVTVCALLFAYTNGFRDAANAIATSVSTRALTPRVAVLLAAVMNLAGAFLGSGVARTVSERLIDPPDGGPGLTVLFAALVGALAWNALTWTLRLPSSSTQALLGGLLGAALAGAATVHWDGVLDKIVLPMVVAPLVGLVAGYGVMVALLWIFRHATPVRAQRGFRMAQTVSAAAMALGHGLQDAQKSMGVIMMALVVAESEPAGGAIPLWTTLACALMLALGTYTGGWRILRTLGRRVIELDPPRGFAAETTAASVMYTASYAFSAPVSTTHVITSAIVGAGATRRISAVRWGVARNVLTGWFLALPAAAAIAALAFWLTRLAVG